MTVRLCAHCGAELLAGMRADARYCNSACRAEATRVRQGVKPAVEPVAAFFQGVGRIRRPDIGRAKGRRPPRQESTL